MRLYLASTSPARLTLLRAAGIEPELIAPGVDEEAAAAAEAARIGRALRPAELVLHLARRKAEAVAATPGLDGLVLGGDSAFEIGGALHGKPHTVERARERWLAQRGRSGVLHSGHWLVDARHPGAGESAGSSPRRRDEVSPVRDDPGGAGSGPAGSSHAGAGRPDIITARDPGSGLLGVGAVAAATVAFVDDLDAAELEAYLASGEPLAVAGAFTIDSLGGPFIERIEGDPSTVVGLSLPTLRRLVRALDVPWQTLWNR